MMFFKWELQANAWIGTCASISIPERMDLRKRNWVMWYYLRVPCTGKSDRRRNTIGDKCIRDTANHRTFTGGVIPNNCDVFYYFNTFVYHLVRESLIFYNFSNITFSKNWESFYPIVLEQRIVRLYILNSTYIKSKNMKTGHFY